MAKSIKQLLALWQELGDQPTYQDENSCECLENDWQDNTSRKLSRHDD